MMKLLHRFVRLIYPHGALRRVLLGPAAGKRFTVVPSMGLTYALGFDSWNYKFLSKHITSGMTVYDVGANCGQMTLLFSRMVGDGGHVLSFEPVPQNAAILRRIIDLNRLHNVKMMEAALASENGKRSFCFSPAFHTMGALSEKVIGRGSEDLLRVDCFTIDHLVEAGNLTPDLIKIDVEGGALEVIQGALNTIKQKRPAIYLELHAQDDNAPELQALRLLKNELGYTIQQMNGEEYVHLEPGWGVPHWCSPTPIKK